jgi:hypothetical protein
MLSLALFACAPRRSEDLKILQYLVCGGRNIIWRVSAQDFAAMRFMLRAHYTLFRHDRPNDWRQKVFSLVAEQLRNEGVDVRIKDRANFRVRRLNLLGQDVPIRDSLAILQNDRTLLYWLLDCHDCTAPWDPHFFLEDLRCRGVLKCQYRPSDLKTLRRRERTLSQMYFRGQLWDERKPVVEILQQQKVVNPDHTPVSYEEYLRELASYRLVLSLPGFDDFCHRDVEAFAAGACVLRPRLRNRFHEELRADFHYISVDTDFGKDTPSEAAARIEERYRQVIDRRDFIASVARNAAAWYDRNIRFPQSMDLTARLLGLA